MAPPDIGSTPNKVFQRSDGVRSGSAVHADQKVAGIKIRADLTDIELQDMADSLSNRLMLDGGNFNADIPASGSKFTGVGNASARTHFAAAGQIQDGSLISAGTSAGTNTITASLTPAITAYVANMMVIFRAGGTNTGAATLNLNSVGAADIKKGPAGTVALAAGDITIGGTYIVVYNGTTGDFELKNPKFPDGFATTDTPQFTAINLGHATDTTLSRSAAGVLAVEGVDLLRSTQNLADVSSAATAFANIKQAASDTATGAIEIATDAEMEAGTDTTRAVVPGRQHRHPSAAKLWGYVVLSGGTPVLSGDFNILSITDGGVGNLGVIIDVNFSSLAYVVVVQVTTGDYGGVNNSAGVLITSQAPASFQILNQEGDGDNADPPAYHIAGFGDQ